MVLTVGRIVEHFLMQGEGLSPRDGAPRANDEESRENEGTGVEGEIRPF